MSIKGQELPRNLDISGTMDFAKGYLHMLREETCWAHNKKDMKLHSPGEKGSTYHDTDVNSDDTGELENYPELHQSKLHKYGAVVISGAGLFSDGYINNSVGFVSTLLKRQYGSEVFSSSTAMSQVSSFAFAGTVAGMLIFGFLVDRYSRKLGMMLSSGILVLFSILIAGSWGSGMPEDPRSMFKLIAAYRFLIGIGIGGEYPSGSTACAEAARFISRGSRNRWFVWFTNFMIDMGYIVSAFVAWLLLYICGVSPDPTKFHGLQASWRVLLGLGAIVPAALMFGRIWFHDSSQFKNNNFKNTKTPYWLIIKRYFPRLVVISIIWGLYDFCVYSWGIYSSQIIATVVTDSNIKTTFGWTVLFNVFYFPGAFIGGFLSDYIGPRLTLMLGAFLQGIIGFIMTGCYDSMRNTTAGFVVAYGIFIATGELIGDVAGLITSQLFPSAARGFMYSIVAAIAKGFAFGSAYAFPAIANEYGDLTKYDSGLDDPYSQKVLLYISSALCLTSGVLSFFLNPLTQSAVNDEDIKFRQYLESNGFDTSKMGSGSGPEKVEVLSDTPSPASKNVS